MQDAAGFAKKEPPPPKSPRDRATPPDSSVDIGSDISCWTTGLFRAQSVSKDPIISLTQLETGDLAAQLQEAACKNRKHEIAASVVT